jgi:hypothetical protein
MTLRRISRPIAVLAVALLAAGCAAIQPAAAQKRHPTTVAGIHVKPCEREHEITFLMFVKGVSCKQGMRLMTNAVIHDRACPRGWRTRHRQVVRLRRDRSPHVTLCQRKHRAFAYNLPVG